MSTAPLNTVARKVYQPAGNMSDFELSSEVVVTGIALHPTNSCVLAPAAIATATGIREEYLSFVRALAAFDFGVRPNEDATEEF